MTSRYSKALYLVILLLISLVGSCTMHSENTSYRYTIDGGSPNRYPAIYDFNGNYFFNKKGEVLLPFVPKGSAMYWGGGTQATLISERNPLPSGIHVRWFSVAENVFWEGSYNFNQQFLQNLTHYKVDDFSSRRTTNFADGMIFTVYVTPGGLVTVWVSGAGETYLVAQFNAQKMPPEQEPDWDDFYYYSVSKMNKAEPKDSFAKETLQNHQTYIKDSLNGKAEYFDDTQPEGKPLTAAPWLRLMKKYDWYLSVNEQYFILRDYDVAYVNAESRFIYASDNQLTKTRPVPRYLSYFIQTKLNNNTPERMEIQFDWDEIMQAFEKMSLVTPMSEPINLYIDITPDLTNVYAYLKKGKESIELKKIKPELTNLYVTGEDKNIPWEEQTKHWK